MAITVKDGVIAMNFGLDVTENVKLSFNQRARLVELLCEELAGVKRGDVVGFNQDSETEINEISELIEILNTPALI
jgi:hypothetical protein